MTTIDCLIISKIIICINTDGYISSEFIGDVSNTLGTLDGKLELFSAILTTHKTRYEQCYSNTARENEFKKTIQDYNLIFGDSFLTLNFVKDIVDFVFVEDFYSVRFANICGSLLNTIKTCDILEIQYTVYTRIMSAIIRCRLYGAQPFDSFLNECVNIVEKITKENENIKQLSFIG